MEKRIILMLVAAACFVSGCASSRVMPNADIQQNGVISFTRLAPQTIAQPVMLGFIPVAQEELKPWVSIDRENSTLSLRKGQEVIASCPIEGNINIKPGTYQLEHKQRAALWYANDNYFSNRGLPIPAPEHKDRYRRGALGEFALFIDKDNAIHSSEVWTDEVGGLRIADEDIRKIYYSLEIGSAIEIR